MICLLCSRLTKSRLLEIQYFLEKSCLHRMHENIPYHLKRAWSANFKMGWYVLLRPLKPELRSAVTLYKWMFGVECDMQLLRRKRLLNWIKTTPTAPPSNLLIIKKWNIKNSSKSHLIIWTHWVAVASIVFSGQHATGWLDFRASFSRIKKNPWN
jgi:hypothetical protein